jgi:hypothetical protein
MKLTSQNPFRTPKRRRSCPDEHFNRSFAFMAVKGNLRRRKNMKKSNKKTAKTTVKIRDLKTKKDIKGGSADPQEGGQIRLK